MSLSDRNSSRPRSRRILPQREDTSCQRWQPPSMGTVGRGIHTLAAELQTKRDEAIAEGYAEGMRQAKEQIKAESASQRQAFEHVMDLLCQPLAAVDPEVEHAIAKLALEIGDQLHISAMDIDPGQISKVVEAALALLSEHEKTVVLQLNPGDYQLVNDALPHLWQEGRVTPRADANIEPGGCIVKGAFSSIDATNATRLAAVRDLVVSGLPHLESPDQDTTDVSE